MKWLKSFLSSSNVCTSLFSGKGNNQIKARNEKSCTKFCFVLSSFPSCIRFVDVYLTWFPTLIFISLSLYIWYIFVGKSNRFFFSFSYLWLLYGVVCFNENVHFFFLLLRENVCSIPFNRYVLPFCAKIRKAHFLLQNIDPPVVSHVTEITFHRNIHVPCGRCSRYSIYQLIDSHSEWFYHDIDIPNHNTILKYIIWLHRIIHFNWIPFKMVAFHHLLIVAPHFEESLHHSWNFKPKWQEGLVKFHTAGFQAFHFYKFHLYEPLFACNQERIRERGRERKFHPTQFIPPFLLLFPHIFTDRVHVRGLNSQDFSIEIHESTLCMYPSKHSKAYLLINS